MVSNKRFIFPNGVVAGYYGENNVETIYINDSPEVKSLFDMYIATPTLVNSLDFRLLTIKTLLKLVRDPVRFIKYNVKENFNLPPSVKDFLVDTFCLIKQGRREIPIHICKQSLLLAKPNYTNGSTLGKNYKFKNPLYENRFNETELDMVECIGKWTSGSNGVEDLIWFMKLLFSK